MLEDEMGVENQNLGQESSSDNYFENSVEEEQIVSEEGVTDLNPEQENIEEQEGVEETTSQDETNWEDNKVQNAFAKRLAKERSKIEAQYDPYRAIMENEAKKYGMTTDEYVQAVQSEMDKETKNNEQKIKLEEEERYSSLTDDEREAIKWSKENKSRVQQQEQWTNDAKALTEKFPEVRTIQDIPEEVLDLYSKYNVPIVEAYELVNKRLVPNRTEMEQKAIRDIKNNKNSNIGSLNKTVTEAPISISDMSTNDFKDLVDKVKRGEIKGF